MNRVHFNPILRGFVRFKCGSRYTLVHEMLGTLVQIINIIYRLLIRVIAMKNCIWCKKSLDDDFIFCPYCGKSQQPKKKTTRRGNGTGSVYKDSNGKYIAEITQGYIIENGKPKRIMKRKKGFTTKKDALTWIELYKHGDINDHTITISELWNTFMENSELSKSKQTAYRGAYKKIQSMIAHRNIDALTVSDLQNVVDTCGNSYYTKKDIKMLLSHLYKLAIRDDYVQNNKSQYIKLPQQNVTAERETLNDDEIKILWNDFKDAPSKVIAGILVMLYTGMRVGELLGVRIENIHLDEHYLVGGTKTQKGKNRKIIIPDKLYPVIQYLLDRTSADGYLCRYNDKNVFYDEWNVKRAVLGIRETITPYCCRHTYVTRLTALKVSPAMLQELVGHEDYETTLIYTHLSVDERLKAVNQL